MLYTYTPNVHCCAVHCSAVHCRSKWIRKFICTYVIYTKCKIAAQCTAAHFRVPLYLSFSLSLFLCLCICTYMYTALYGVCTYMYIYIYIYGNVQAPPTQTIYVYIHNTYIYIYTNDHALHCPALRCTTCFTHCAALLCIALIRNILILLLLRIMTAVIIFAVTIKTTIGNNANTLLGFCIQPIIRKGFVLNVLCLCKGSNPILLKDTGAGLKSDHILIFLGRVLRLSPPLK